MYDESLDTIEGFIHVKDLFPHLAAEGVFDIGKIIREVLFVPPSMRIVDLLLKMRVSGCHIAMVVDEFGGTDGLVTMEDLYEELVGEIQDEHDGHESAPTMRWIAISLSDNISIGAIYTAISIARSYCVRRAFNHYIGAQA